jgi:hypothetical protein
MWQQNENVIARSVTLRSNDILMLIMEQSPSFGGMEQSPSVGGMEHFPAVDGLARSKSEQADAPRAMNLFRPDYNTTF